MRRLAVSALPRRFVLLVDAGIETGGMVTFHAVGAFHEIVLRISLELTASADWRTVVAGPCRPPIHQHRELRRCAGIVQRRTANAASAQLLVALGIVVVASHRSAKTLSAYR